MPLTYAPNADDRRRGLRVPQTRGVKLFQPAANRYIPAQTVDLSPSGLRLTLPSSAPLIPNTLLQVHVASATSSSSVGSKRTMIPARVVWVDRSPGSLQVGLEFAAAMTSAATSAA